MDKSDDEKITEAAQRLVAAMPPPSQESVDRIAATIAAMNLGTTPPPAPKLSNDEARNEYVRKLVDQAPPLTPAAAARFARILRPDGAAPPGHRLRCPLPDGFASGSKPFPDGFLEPLPDPFPDGFPDGFPGSRRPDGP